MAKRQLQASGGVGVGITETWANGIPHLYHFLEYMIVAHTTLQRDFGALPGDVTAVDIRWSWRDTHARGHKSALRSEMTAATLTRIRTTTLTTAAQTLRESAEATVAVKARRSRSRSAEAGQRQKRQAIGKPTKNRRSQVVKCDVEFVEFYIASSPSSLLSSSPSF